MDEFSDLQDTYRMYSVRDFDLVTVVGQHAGQKNTVLRFLQKKHATSRNLLFGFERYGGTAGSLRSDVAIGGARTRWCSPRTEKSSTRTRFGRHTGDAKNDSGEPCPPTRRFQ